MSSGIRPCAAVSARRRSWRAPWIAGALAGAAWFCTASDVLGHGFAGSRFFPATLTTDDPFVADELSLPTLTVQPDSHDTPPVHETDVGVDVAKRLFPDFGIEVGQSWQHLTQSGNGKHEGFGNVDLGAKYQFLLNAEHEAIASLGLNVDLGGTGAKGVGASRYSSYTPGLFFGKGFGDLPESVPWLRPLALTGLVGYQVPGSGTSSSTVTDPTTGALSLDVAHNPDLLVWGFALEYSLIYLQSQVRDVGLPKPLDRMVPVVEFAFQTPVTAGFGQKTTGTINPGLIWAGQYSQIAAELIVPANHDSGRSVGGIMQLHFFLDDLFRGSWLGGPLFGN